MPQPFASVPLLAFERLAQRAFGRMSFRFGPGRGSSGEARWKEKFAADPEGFARKGRFGSEMAYERRSELALDLAEAGDHRPWIALCESGAPIRSLRLQKKELEDVLPLLAGPGAPPEALRALAVANFDPFFSDSPRAALNWLGLCATSQPEGLEENARVRRWVKGLGERMLKDTPKTARTTDSERHFFGVSTHLYVSVAEGLARAQPERVAPLARWLAEPMSGSPKAQAVFFGALSVILAAVAPGRPELLQALLPATLPSLRERTAEFLAGCEIARKEAWVAPLPGARGSDARDPRSHMDAALEAVGRLAADAIGGESMEKAASEGLRDMLRVFLEAQALRAAIQSPSVSARGEGLGGAAHARAARRL